MVTPLERMYNMFIDILNGKLLPSARLRFDRTYLTVSEIAQQFYCEHKLCLMYKEGKIETEEKKLGTEIHEEIFRGESVSITELIQKVLTSKIVIATMPIVTIYEDIPIVGIPDAIIFSDGTVSHVIELKTTSRWVGKVFTCEYVQAQLYSYILKREKLSNSDVVVAILKVKRDLEIDNSVRIKLFKKVHELSNKLLSGAEHVSLRGDRYSIHLYHYDYSIESYLTWALGFWKMTREEYVPLSPGKCAKCEYRHLCKYAKLIMKKKITR